MDFIAIFKYLQNKIPKGHELGVYVHMYHELEYKYPEYHPFIQMLCDTLKEINDVIPDYASKMIDRISEIMDKSQTHQIIANLSEIVIMRQAVEIADEVDGKKYIISEPRINSRSKNPELRSISARYYYAAEVKAPSLSEYIEHRQSGFQKTSHLHDRTLLDGEIQIDPRVLTVKGFLESTEDKYKEYSQLEEYKDDLRLLFIVWDDYINEVIPALISPQCGMFTPRSFWGKSDFSLIDGVFVVRHQHQFIRSLNGIEFLNGLEHAFQLKAPLPVAFVQNPKGREIPQELIDSFCAVRIEYDSVSMAEYRAVDLVDWRTGVAITGLDSVPAEYHKKVFRIIKDSADKHEPRTNPDAANFGTINLDYIVKRNTNFEGLTHWENVLAELNKSIAAAVLFQKSVELRERQYNQEMDEAYGQEMAKQMQLLFQKEYKNTK